MVFDKQWFAKYNNVLVRMARLPFIGELIFNFEKFGHYVDRKKIIAIRPNSVVEFIAYKKGYKKIEVREHFFIRNEYALRLQQFFYPIWITFHTWDMVIANRFAPQLNLGFDTLTVYPNYDGEAGATTMDGNVRNYQAGGGLSWATIHDATNGQGATTVSTADTVLIQGYTGSWTMLKRSFFLFDTHTLTSDATISAAVLSLYGQDKNDDKSIGVNIDIYTSNPASNTALVTEDYDQVGTTSQTGSPISYASWSTSGYNNFTLSSTGRGNISKTSITKFGARNQNYDVSNTEPTTSAGAGTNSLNWWSADHLSDKPKLVITYTLPVTTNAIFFGCNF